MSSREGEERGAPTGLGAEAIFLVAVVVLRGAAPAVAVAAALGGAAVVGGALEAERELAGLSITVATHGEQGWGRGGRGGCKCERGHPPGTGVGTELAGHQPAGSPVR